MQLKPNRIFFMWHYNAVYSFIVKSMTKYANMVLIQFIKMVLPCEKRRYKLAGFADMQEYVGIWVKTGRQESQMETGLHGTLFLCKNHIINVAIVLSFWKII